MQHNNNIFRKKIILGVSLLGIITAIWCCQSVAAPSFKFISNPFNAKSIASNNETYGISAPGLNPKVLRLALTSYKNARASGIGDKDILTIIDYSMPSTARRLWIVDMRTKQILYNTHVAHGSGSGDNYATRFSNRHGSRMSSIGMFLTGDIYQGHYGNSLNLFGLEDKYNSNAHARRIVIHKAHYVNEDIIKQIGRAGRSWGCPALNVNVADKIMHKIKNGSLVFAYYPDQGWLRESKLLQST